MQTVPPLGDDVNNELARPWITGGVSKLEREQGVTRASKKGS